MSKRFQILADLEKGQNGSGKKIEEAYIAQLPEEVVKILYAPNYKKHDFWGEIMQRELINKFVYVAVYEGEGIVKLNRELIGPREVLKAPKNTIRGKYGRLLLKDQGILRLSNGMEIVRNIIHATDETPGEFEREYKAFRDYL